MTRALGCRLSGAWCRWPSGRDRGDSGIDLEERALVGPDAFPGRFSPFRRFPEALEPLPLVAGAALMRAGLWTPGSGAAVSGGLVVGVDRLFVPPLLRFATAVRHRFGDAASPMTFIESHPSTIPTFLGLLYGLADYQTLVVRGSLSGGRALAHAVDALRTRRLERVLVVGARESESGTRVAAALCLDASADAGGTALGVTIATPSRTETEDADPLVALARWSRRPEPRVIGISIADASRDESFSVSVETD